MSQVNLSNNNLITETNEWIGVNSRNNITVIMLTIIERNSQEGYVTFKKVTRIPQKGSREAHVAAGWAGGLLRMTKMIKKKRPGNGEISPAGVSKSSD